MKNGNRKYFVYYLLTILTLVVVGIAQGQTYVTDVAAPDAKAAAMGLACSSQPDGAWAGFHNPAAWSQQPTVYGGHSYVDLGNVEDGDSRLESSAAGIGVDGVFGVGVMRQEYVFARIDEVPDRIPAGISRRAETSDYIGAGVDLAQLLFRGNRIARLAVGANYKMTKQTTNEVGAGDITVLHKNLDELDLGALARLSIGLTGSHDGGRSSSELTLSGSVVGHNTMRKEFANSKQGIVEDPGYAVTVGFGSSLAIKRFGRNKHMVRLTGNYEFREFQQEHPALDLNVQVFTRHSTERFGAELALADFLFARAGRMRLGDRDQVFDTYGVGLEFATNGGEVQLKIDYARTPWLYGDVLVSGASPAETQLIDQFTVQLAFGL